MNERPAALIHQDIYDGVETYVLREPATGSQARVLPGLGNNVLSFETTVAGKALGVIAPPASIAALRDYPARYSIPVLFPYPGRLAGGRFTFRGREYQLPLKAGPHVSHGTVNNRPWQVRKAESGRPTQAAPLGRASDSGPVRDRVGWPRRRTGWPADKANPRRLGDGRQDSPVLLAPGKCPDYRRQSPDGRR